jgi:hypothetical protein
VLHVSDEEIMHGEVPISPILRAAIGVPPVQIKISIAKIQ